MWLLINFITAGGPVGYSAQQPAEEAVWATTALWVCSQLYPHAPSSGQWRASCRMHWRGGALWLGALHPVLSHATTAMRSHFAESMCACAAYLCQRLTCTSQVAR
jgi:hypothetical protein